MSPGQNSLGEKFVRLALAIDLHQPGYIDSYFGPPEWKAQAESQGLRDIQALKNDLTGLAEALDGDQVIGFQRRDFLARQLKAMQTSLLILEGVRLPLVEEVEGMYDITPAWTSEKTFEDAHQVLDELLPPGGSLQERAALRKKSLEISASLAEQLLPGIIAHLQTLTREQFPLPAEETFELSFVNDQPWRAYNWYLGNGYSRIEINTDLPIKVLGLTGLMAHEGYPGHHTELAIKETELYLWAGYQEHCMTLINAPSCVISEGIADCALDTVMDDEVQIAWLAEQVLPRAGLSRLDARREHRIEKAFQNLAGVRPNAAFLLHEEGADEKEVSQYLQRFGLETEAEASKAIAFLNNPLFRSYIFTYYLGKELLETLFESKGDRKHWFTRLLSEPVTPGQVREWIDQK